MTSLRSTTAHLVSTGEELDVRQLLTSTPYASTDEHPQRSVLVLGRSMG